MDDDSDIPAELTLNAATGVLDLELDFERKTDYTFTVEITNTGGNAPDVTTIPGIFIEVICGSNSAILTAPTLDTLTKGNIYDTILSIDDKFRTSNDLCPVIDYALSTGANEYDFVDDETYD
jgi:hypothetical protein